MCRIDPEIHDAALERKGCRTVVMKGRKYRGYVYVEAEADQSARETDRRVYPRTALVNLELVNATQSGQMVTTRDRGQAPSRRALHDRSAGSP
jgi:hypothetical protein